MAERTPQHPDGSLPFHEPDNNQLHDPERLVIELAREGVYSIIPTIVNVEGRGFGPRVSIRQLPAICGAGQSTDGSSIVPYGVINASDVRIKVDPTAVYRLPGYRGLAVGFGNAVDPVTNAPNPGCFRTRLQQALAQAEEEFGIQFLGGLELEAFLRRKEGTLEKDKWVKGIGPKQNYQRWPDQDPLFEATDQILAGLAEAGLHVTVCHTEVSPWQIEINTAAANLVRAAEDYLVLRTGLKKLADAAGYKAIYKAKPVEHWNGSGLHTHLSASRVNGGENALFKADRTFTEMGGYFFGGLFAEANALTYLGNLRQEDYLRLNTPGYEAPNVNAMGWANRTCSFRLTGNTIANYHVEFRVPCPGSAHGLALFIGMVAVGLNGVREKIEPPALVDWNAYEDRQKLKSLPGSRDEARKAFVESKVMRSAFTEVQFNAFADLAI